MHIAGDLSRIHNKKNITRATDPFIRLCGGLNIIGCHELIERGTIGNVALLEWVGFCWKKGKRVASIKCFLWKTCHGRGATSQQ